jgi:2-hydroxychromene-2-carboxylate isomerase
MKHITFYLDFISPNAYLAFDKLPEALMGLSYRVTYKPIILAPLLEHPAHRLSLAQKAVASDARGLPNRYVCEMLFKQELKGEVECADAVKAQLKAHTDEAVALGVASVPTLAVDGQLFSGPQALSMLRAHLDAVASVAQGIRR